MASLNKLISIFESYPYSYLDSEYVFELIFPEKKERDEIFDFFCSNSISSEKIGDCKLRIYYEQKKFVLYNDFNVFRCLFNYNTSKGKILIVIKHTEGTSPCIYKAGQVDQKYGLAQLTFENAFAYFQLIEFLKTKEHNEDNCFYFVDHFNKDNRKIIFTSLKREGKLTLEYKKELPEFTNNYPFKKSVDRFMDSFSENNKHLPKFIKTEFFNFLSSVPKDKRIEELFLKLPNILDAAEQNFEIYLSDLSLDRLKNEYIEFKSKYLNQFREILSKITTQIIAFPLSIAASAFATYKVSDSLFMCSVILTAFTLFTVYTLFILRAYKEDVDEAYISFQTSFLSIQKNLFFVKYPEELSAFSNVKEFVGKRVTFLITCIRVYSIILVLINALFIIFVLVQSMALSTSIVIGVIVLLILLMFYFFLLYK